MRCTVQTHTTERLGRLRYRTGSAQSYAQLRRSMTGHTGHAWPLPSRLQEWETE